MDDSTFDHLRQVLHEAEPGAMRYRIREEIGQGGMGTVYLADDTALDRPVAMKVLRESGLNPEAVERMLREAKIVARLEHPGIVPVHDVGRLPDGRTFYVMKWVKGRRLDEVFDPGASLPERLRVFQRICETVAFAHAHGVIHRDLKPQNVMVGEYGEVLVLDWGVAKVLCEMRGDDIEETLPLTSPPASSMPTARHTAHGTVLGTPAYMSPEQARGEIDAVDERSDVFTLGGILFFLLTARPPRERNAEVWRSPRSLNKNVPRRLDAISAKAMSSHPPDRYATAAQLAEDIAHFLDGEAVSAYREGPLERLGRWAWWYRTPILIILGYLLVRVVLILRPWR